MTTADKLYSEWLQNPPTEARFREVKKLLDYYFPGEWTEKRGSHIVVKSERLKELIEKENMPGITWIFTIPRKKGRKVKGTYIKRLLEYIQILEESSI